MSTVKNGTLQWEKRRLSPHLRASTAALLGQRPWTLLDSTRFLSIFCVVKDFPHHSAERSWDCTAVAGSVHWPSRAPGFPNLANTQWRSAHGIRGSREPVAPFPGSIHDPPGDQHGFRPAHLESGVSPRAATLHTKPAQDTRMERAVLGTTNGFEGGSSIVAPLAGVTEMIRALCALLRVP